MEALVPREWTRKEMYRAAEAGVFRPDERLELIDGQLVTKMSPQGDLHAICILLIEDWLRDLTRKEYHVRTQMPIVLGPRDEPEPDLAVVMGGVRGIRRGHPTPDRLMLVVEVGDSTLVQDRRFKLPRYASAGIPEVWLADVEGRRLEVYRSPREGGYDGVRVLESSESVAPLFRLDSRIAVSELFSGATEE